MTLGMIFLIIVVIVMVVFEYNKKISTKKFINDVEPYFRFLMEDDYKFLLTVKYGEDIDVSVLYTQRIRNALVGMVAVIFVFIKLVAKQREFNFSSYSLKKKLL